MYEVVTPDMLRIAADPAYAAFFVPGRTLPGNSLLTVPEPVAAC